jgi:hypothetical protein
MSMTVRVFPVLASAAVLAVGLAAPAQAMDPYFCQGYARTAISQAHQAERRPRCNYLLSQGTRWSFDYRAHYDWCLGAGPGQANGERQARWAALNRCSDYDHYPPPGYHPRPWY